MGRFATNLAAYAANVDNLPPKDKLPQISFWEAVLPTSVSDLLSDPKKVKKVRLLYHFCFCVLSCDQDFLAWPRCSGLFSGSTKESVGSDGWIWRRQGACCDWDSAIATGTLLLRLGGLSYSPILRQEWLRVNGLQGVAIPFNAAEIWHHCSQQLPLKLPPPYS
jgi:hypothetical protein